MLNLLHKPTDQAQAQQLINRAINSHDNTQKAIFLTACSVRGLQWEEWKAYTEALRQNALPVEFLGQTVLFDWITIREQRLHSPAISLAVSMVAAAAGVPVAKLGDSGYGAAVGYSDILEYIGVSMHYDAQQAQAQLEKSNFCYLHAPAIYPALAAFSEARRAMAAPTWLDTALPLLHPAPQTQMLVATATLEWLRLYQYWYQQHQQKFFLLQDFSGAAEISLTDNFKALTTETEDTIRLSDHDLPNLDKNTALDTAGSVIFEARKLWKILNEAGSNEEMMTVIANAAWWIRSIRQYPNLSGALAEAEAALSSGRALECLERLL